MTRKDKGVKLMVFCMALILTCCTDQPPNESLNSLYTAKQFVENRIISGGSFSQDGSKILYTIDVTGRPAAWIYDIETKERILAHSDTIDPIYSLAIFGNNDDLIFTSNRNGSPYIHIYEKEGDYIKDITPGDQVRARWRGVKSDFSGIYYTSNVRANRKTDLYEYSFNKKESKLIFQNDTQYSLSYISNDHRYILLHERKTEDITNLHLYDMENETLQSISPDNNNSAFYGLGFSNDSNQLYYLTNYNNEFIYLKRYDLQTGIHEPIIKEDWDIVGISFSSDQQLMAVYINENGHAKAKIWHMKQNRFLDIPFLASVDVERVRFSPNNKHLLLQVAGYNHPKDLMLYNLEGKTTELIAAGLNQIDGNHLSKPLDTVITSYDGLAIPAFLYLPQNATNKQGSALVWTHGGPGGQFRANYNQSIQFMVNQGYTVLAVNNRGSSGYGKTFKSLDNKKHGIDDLQDVLAGKRFLASLDGIDEERIGIIGDSYGGYLALAALTFHPDEFAVGVDMFGISNWLHVLTNIPSFWETRRRALYEEMGHPQKDSLMLYNKSPLFFSHQIERPLMVIQGANDARVPQSESDSIVARVKANGIPVKYLLFEDEGHGIRKKANQIKSLDEISGFFDLYLTGTDNE